MPQIKTCSTHQNVGQELQAAMDSIPAYIERSDPFIILEPPVCHADTGRTCTQRTWARCGWCRVELAAWVLAMRRYSPVLHVQDLAGNRGLRLGLAL